MQGRQSMDLGEPQPLTPSVEWLKGRAAQDAAALGMLRLAAMTGGVTSDDWRLAELHGPDVLAAHVARLRTLANGTFDTDADVLLHATRHTLDLVKHTQTALHRPARQRRSGILSRLASLIHASPRPPDPQEMARFDRALATVLERRRAELDLPLPVLHDHSPDDHLVYASPSSQAGPHSRPVKERHPADGGRRPQLYCPCRGSACPRP